MAANIGNLDGITARECVLQGERPLLHVPGFEVRRNGGDIERAGWEGRILGWVSALRAIRIQYDGDYEPRGRWIKKPPNAIE